MCRVATALSQHSLYAVPDFIAADIHIRLDQPARSLRFAAWVDKLARTDRLTIVGDLCDFWFVSREMHQDPMSSPGLNALARFRDRGGDLAILAGNHDAWIGEFYRQKLGARFVPDTLNLDLNGLRVHLAHGHRLGGVGWKKKLMESRAFLEAFRLTPDPIATLLEARLDRSNDLHRAHDDSRQACRFEAYARTLAGSHDLVVIGHLHTTIDRMFDGVRMIVPGSWHQKACFVRITEGQAELIVKPD